MSTGNVFWTCLSLIAVYSTVCKCTQSPISAGCEDYSDNYYLYDDLDEIAATFALQIAEAIGQVFAAIFTLGAYKPDQSHLSEHYSFQPRIYISSVTPGELHFYSNQKNRTLPWIYQSMFMRMDKGLTSVNMSEASSVNMSQFIYSLSSTSNLTRQKYLPMPDVLLLKSRHQQLYKLFPDILPNMNQTKALYWLTEGVLQLPVMKFSTSYIVPSFNGVNLVRLMSQNNGTVVTVQMNTIQGMPSSKPVIVNLDALESVLIFMLQQDLAGKPNVSKLAQIPIPMLFGDSGSEIDSNKPIAVTLLSFPYVNSLPSIGDFSMHAYREQLIPIHYWGTSYVVTPVYPLKQYIVRIYAYHQNTVVSYSSASMKGSTNLNHKGDYVTIQGGSDPISVVASSPVQVIQHTNGSDNQTFMSNVPAINQFSSSSYTIPTLQSGEFYHFLAITTGTAHKNELTLDGNPLRPIREDTAPSPLSNYTVMVVQVAMGNHTIVNNMTGAKFGLLVYGVSHYAAYGFLGGLDLSGCSRNDKSTNTDAGGSTTIKELSNAGQSFIYQGITRNSAVSNVCTVSHKSSSVTITSDNSTATHYLNNDFKCFNITYQGNIAAEAGSFLRQTTTYTIESTEDIAAFSFVNGHAQPLFPVESFSYSYAAFGNIAVTAVVDDTIVEIDEGPQWSENYRSDFYNQLVQTQSIKLSENQTALLHPFKYNFRIIESNNPVMVAAYLDTWYMQVFPVKFWQKSFIIPTLSLSGYHVFDLGFFPYFENTQINYFNPTSAVLKSFILNKGEFSSIKYNATEGPAILYASKPVSVFYGSTIPTIVQGLGHFKSAYTFLPNLGKGIQEYIDITILSTKKSGLLLDKSAVNILKEVKASSPFQNYSVLSVALMGGNYHTLKHTDGQTTFGAVVYGIKDHGTLEYAYSGGFQLTTAAGPDEGTTTAPTDAPLVLNAQNKNVSEHTCYFCNDVPSVQYCYLLQQCKPGQVCFLEKYHSPTGRIKFRAGCAPPQFCASNSGKRSSTPSLCTTCCHTNYCNNHGCGDPGPATLANRGPICLDCDAISNANDCDQVALCSPTELCSIEVYPWGLVDKRYTLGCKNRWHCPSADSVLKKRSSPSCSSCCQMDYCNKNCTMSSQPSLVG